MADEDLIDDQFQLVMCIASGASSQVWECIEKGSGRHLAMKLLKKDSPDFKVNRGKMRKEADIMKAVMHPLIVKIEKFSTNRDHTYILMEHFRASNLKIQIKNEPNKVHLRIRQLFEGVCTALSHVHSKGYIHRDIKPDNILMNRAGEVKLCDFSLSSRAIKGIGRLFAGRAKEIQGTRTYIAPETIRRQQPTIRTDLYSLGIFFFEALTRKTPFQATSPEELLQKHLRVEPPNPSEFNPNVAPEMDRIVAKLLKKKPKDRYADVNEVLAEIKRGRIFKEDVVDLEATAREQEDKNSMAALFEARLDSRADAKLVNLLQTNSEFAQQFEEQKKVKDAKKQLEAERLKQRIQASEKADAAKAAAKSGKAAPAAAPAPVAQPVPMPMPMPMPMPQQMPMPGFQPGFPSFPTGYAPYPQPGMPMPMPQGMPMPAPGMPQFPPQVGYPQPMQPPQMPFPQPQQQPVPVPRQPNPQAQQVPAQPVPPAAKPAAPAPNRPAANQPPSTQPPTDLEYMTDLPDVV